MKTTGTCSRHRNQRLLVKELLVDGKEVKSDGSTAWNDISGKPAVFPPVVGTSAETVTLKPEQAWRPHETAVTFTRSAVATSGEAVVVIEYAVDN